MEPRRIDEHTWELPIGYVEGMRVPGRIYASDKLFDRAREDRAIEQVANVATLPGIIGYSLAMPDIHWGYGFPIGGVAATDVDAGGVVSPGGVGFDIGCGVRLLRSEVSWQTEGRERIRDLVAELGKRVPRGVGGGGYMRLSRDELDRVLRDGLGFTLGRGIGWDADAELTEDRGRLPHPDPEAVSERAKARGAPQLGSLGAGNHFLEVQVVDEVRDAAAAEVMGLFEGQVCVMIHSGSRGIGHQSCQDALRTIDRLMPSLGYRLPDRQLACVPVDHPEARSYLGAMDAAGNFARANRHVLSHVARECFAAVFGRSARDLGLEVVYDVAHNLAKFEEHTIDGRTRRLCVHRKGATRALGPGHPELPERYRDIGQPVIIPGSMGSASFVLTGRAEAEALAFASTCHGAGRQMSRTQAKKKMRGEDLKAELERQGIVLARSQWKLLSEEAPYAYKDASEVVETCEAVGLSSVVARLRPVGVVKG